MVFICRKLHLKAITFNLCYSFVFFELIKLEDIFWFHHSTFLGFHYKIGIHILNRMFHSLNICEIISVKWGSSHILLTWINWHYYITVTEKWYWFIIIIVGSESISILCVRQWKMLHTLITLLNICIKWTW